MVEIKTEGPDVRCVFSGRLDTAACDGLWEQLEPALGAGPATVCFDMDNVDYIASAFLRICIRAAKVVPKGALTVENPTPVVKKTFKIAGLDGALNIA
jgi:anti-anti-sigma factor